MAMIQNVRYLKTYNDVSPLSISEPALMGDIKQLFIEEVDS